MTEIIEQLGGYEAAKAHIRELVSDYDEGVTGKTKLYDFQFSVGQVEQALLEYRRQHNIFEVGDWITSGNETYQILSIEYGDLYKVANNTYCESGCFSHATDAEIKAGKRLEVK